MEKATTLATPKKGSWAADEIKRVPIKNLMEYAQNSRVHSDEQIDQLAKSIQEFGFTNPILQDEDGMIIAGHGRLRAAVQLGLKSVPVMTAKNWTDAQKRAYVIADNRLAELATWDMDVLISEAQGLLDMDFDVELVGIDEAFLGANLVEDYEPELEPTTGMREVTPEDVERTQRGMDETYVKASTQKLIEVICPHCGEEFEVTG